MDPVGKNVFKGIVLHKVSRENTWGPTLFWGLILYSRGFRKVVLVCIVGVILLLALSPEQSKEKAGPGSATPAVTQTALAPQDISQVQTISTAEPPATALQVPIEDVVTARDVTQVGVSSPSPEALQLDTSASVCEVTKEQSASQTCSNSSVLALTDRYKTLVSAVEAKGDLNGGNYAENQKTMSLLTDCETEQCKKGVLLYAIDVFKAEALK